MLMPDLPTWNSTPNVQSKILCIALWYDGINLIGVHYTGVNYFTLLFPDYWYILFYVASTKYCVIVCMKYINKCN